MQIFLQEQGTIKEKQIGFRKGFRTSDHMFVLKTIVDSHIKKKRKLYTCFIDLKKAFDSVRREAMFYKVEKLNVGEKFLKSVKSMYSTVKCSVKTTEGI